MRIERLWPDEDTGPYLLGITFDTVGGRLEVVGVEMWGREPVSAAWSNPSPAESPEPITSVAIRLPLDRIATEALRFIPTPRRAERPASPRPAGRIGRPPTYGKEHFEEVAAVYNEALAAHQNPLTELSARFGISKTNAAGWVTRCRALGLLPPTTRGRAAGVEQEPTDAPRPAGVVSAGELRAGLAGRDRIARCSLCAMPVFVHDDGSTTGGVDTLVGVRCDQCLNVE